MNLTPLLQRCRQQDDSAQKELYQKFSGYALSVCMRYAPSREDAQELMHDGFLKVLRHLDKYDTQKQFKLWIRRIMINTVIDHYRRAAQMPTEAITPDCVIDEATQAIEALSMEEFMALVQSLSPAYRTVFNLYAIEGFSHKEIAEILQITEATSRSTLAKARNLLQKRLNSLYAI